MNCLSISAAGDETLSKLRHLRHIKNPYILRDFKRVDSCDLDVLLITNDILDNKRLVQLGLNQTIFKRLHKAWVDICTHSETKNDSHLHNMDLIEKESSFLVNPVYEKDFLVRRICSGRDCDLIVLFLEEGQWFPLDSLFMLARACKVENGLIPLHVSAVQFQDRLFLFGGPSGAGKSTVAKILMEKGGVLLDEDQVMVRKNSDGSYSANAWGYSMKTCDVPIRAVFQLVKSNRNTLLPLSPMQSASFLLSQADQVAGRMLHNDLYRCLFRQVAEMARSIPAYQLHFSLDSQFWTLIQEEINLG